MKDAISATWLMGLVICFIFLFAGFLAYSINYTKAFRVKNEIIKLIENDEGYIEFNDSDIETASTDVRNDSTEGKIYNFILNSGYNFRALPDSNDINASNTICRNDGENTEGFYKAGGYCIVKFCPPNGPSYYKVTTYTILQIPFLNIAIRLPISGETRGMYYDSTRGQISNDCVESNN